MIRKKMVLKTKHFTKYALSIKKNIDIYKTNSLCV